MGRGVSAGGGQSSLGYLFGGGEAPNHPKTSGDVPQKLVPQASNGAPQKSNAASPVADVPQASDGAPQKSNADSSPEDVTKQVPAGIQGSQANNYFRADGQNCGNFITDRPSTKVHAAPGGGSSLDYLFGGNGK